MTVETLLKHIYDAFNKRDIETVLAALHPEVNWPNSWEGGRLHGIEAVRDYWTRQWAAIDPNIVPLAFKREPDGRVTVQVRAVVRDRAGHLLAEHTLEHIYTFEDDLVSHMEVRE